MSDRTVAIRQSDLEKMAHRAATVNVGQDCGYKTVWLGVAVSQDRDCECQTGAVTVTIRQSDWEQLAHTGSATTVNVR